MPPSTRIPPLLQPYIHLPQDDSHLLLTSTLGASANWLLIRFLCDALSNTPQDGGEEGHNVVLVSWMREYEFWKQEARKGSGLDLEKLRREGRFAFVDGLSGLCLDATEDGILGRDLGDNNVKRPQVLPPGGSPAQRGPQFLPARGPPAGRIVPTRGPPQAAAQPASVVTATITSTQTANTISNTQGHYVLKSLDLEHFKAIISGAVSSLTSTTSTRSTTQRTSLVILDNPDLLLALNASINPSTLTSTILHVHTLPTVSHILTHIQSDTPLLSLSTPPQPLELDHHNFLVKCAHMSSRILGVRVLDTGVARDVSGVIRVTENKAGWLGLGFDGEGKGGDESGRGKEFLYQIKGDGSVKVFERGAGGEG